MWGGERLYAGVTAKIYSRDIYIPCPPVKIHQPGKKKKKHPSGIFYPADKISPGTHRSSEFLNAQFPSPTPRKGGHREG